MPQPEAGSRTEDIVPTIEGEEEAGQETGVTEGVSLASMQDITGQAEHGEEQKEEGNEDGNNEEEEEEGGDDDDDDDDDEEEDEERATEGDEHSLDFTNIASEELEKMSFATDLPLDADPSTLKKIMTVELARLKAMKPSEFVKKIDELKHLHNQIYASAERFIREVIAQIPYVTPVLKQVGEYDQEACDKLLAIADKDWIKSDINAEQREEIVQQLEQRMVEAVQIHFDFTHQISYVASPLTVWRLNACTAVWAGNNEIVSAHKVTKFVFDDPDAKRGKEGDDDNDDSEAEAMARAKAAEEAAARRAAQVAEEEEQARLAAEKPVEGELDPEEIASSERPPLKAWNKYVYTTGEGADKRVICYVRAPPDCLVSEDRLICTYGNAMAEWPNLPGNAEAIGKFVCIRPVHPKVICILPDEPWIIGIPHKYGKNSAREVVIFSMEADETGPPKQTEQEDQYDMMDTERDDDDKPTNKLPWVDLQTSDVSYEDSRYLEFKLTRLPNSIALAPAARIRRDSAEVGRVGGKLASLVDNRVTVVIPPSALKVTCTYSIQVQAINQHHAHMLRDQNLTFMSQFTACSPLVVLTGPKKILFKPSVITLPLTDLNPTTQVVIMSNASMPEAFIGHRRGKSNRDTGSDSEGDDRTPVQNVDMDADDDEDDENGSRNGDGPLELDPFQRSLLLPKLLAGASSSHAEVAVVCSGLEDSNWRVWEGAEFVETKNTDICIFNVPRLVPRKFMAIQTRTVVDNDSLLHMAQVLERSLSQRIVYVCLRQMKSDPGRVCFFICLVRDLEKTFNQLAAKGFTEGEKPIGPLFIYERQSFDIVFKGNVRPKKDPEGRSSVRLAVDKGKMRITFNTSLRNEYIVDVEESDPSAQVACERYRGFIEISYKQMVKVPVGKGRSSRVGPMKRFAIEMQTHLLCQLLITLPKKAIEVDGNAALVSYHFYPNDTVTNDFLHDLARKLPGESWRRLGFALDLSRTQLQAVGGRAESTGNNKALTMLKTWVRNIELKVDRVSKLKTALTAIGRADLTAELQLAKDKEEITVTPSPGATPLLSPPIAISS